MPDYSKTLIYKTQHQDKPELLYIGSTTDFRDRKYSHKGNCNNPNINFKLYQLIRDNGGWECFNMVRIKDFPCDNRREAEAEEDRIIMEMKSILNSKRASRTNKQYHIDNKDKLKEKQKIYVNDNRDLVLEQKKQHYINNKYIINIKASQKITCECGCVVRKSDIARHKKSKKHLDHLKENNK